MSFLPYLLYCQNPPHPYIEIATAIYDIGISCFLRDSQFSAFENALCPCVYMYVLLQPTIPHIRMYMWCGWHKAHRCRYNTHRRRHNTHSAISCTPASCNRFHPHTLWSVGCLRFLRLYIIQNSSEILEWACGLHLVCVCLQVRD